MGREAEGRLDVLQPGDQDQRVDGGLSEAAGEIEPLRTVVQGMDEHCGDPDFAGSRADPEQRIPNERSAEPGALFVGCDGQTCEDYDGDRIGHVAASPARDPIVIDGTRREGVIPLDLLASAGDEGPGSAGFLVPPGASPDPSVQARDAALKGIDLMPLVKRFRGAERLL